MNRQNGEKRWKRGLLSRIIGERQRKEGPPSKAEQNSVEEQPAVVSGQEEQPSAVETVCLAKDSQLYGVYCRINRLPPRPEDAVFDATLFHGAELLPTEETMAVLKRLDRSAVAVMKRWNEAELEPVDAEPVLLVSRDKMRVYLFVFPPMFDGEDLTRAGLEELLEKEKITCGVSNRVMQGLEREPVYMRLMLLASGVPPVNGKDGRVVDRFRRTFEICLTVRNDNTIDYRDLGWLQTAVKGDVLCEIEPPSQAVSGFDVYGQELPGKDGRAADIPQGAGTELAEDGTALLAQISGAVTFQNDRFRVDPLVVIEGNVDTAVGHLDVVGDILVKGDVKQGFIVKATGDITVGGGVEGAVLEAGGSVQIGLGMNGSSTGSIRAGGNVYSKFFENTTVWAGKTIVCDNIVNSDIASEEDVQVTTGRGIIIGGSITALRRVEATTIGNHSNRAVEITLGNTDTYLRERKALEETRSALSAQIEDLQKDLRFLERQPDTAAQKEKLNEVNLQLKMSHLKFSKLEAEYKKVLEREANIAKCRLQAQMLYPPVTITMGKAVKNIRKNIYNALIYQKDGEIHVGSL